MISLVAALICLLIIGNTWDDWNFLTLLAAIFGSLFLYDLLSLKGIALFFAEEEVASESAADSLKTKLEKIDKLYANHLLTAEEYAERRANILRAQP